MRLLVARGIRRKYVVRTVARTPPLMASKIDTTSHDDVRNDGDDENEEGINYLPQERGKILSIYRKILDAGKDSDASAIDEAILSVLLAHPFVKAKKIETFHRGCHEFTVQGFICDVYKFRRWLKSKEGRPFAAEAGGPSDDGLYTVSPVIRALLPRGLHRVEARCVDTDETSGFFFRGIPKFTGLIASDEDEKSNSHRSSSAFFYRGKTMKDAATFFRTLKSNGENAKMSLRRLDGILYLLAGSKNTCLIWPADEPSTKYYPAHSPPSLSSDASMESLGADGPGFFPAPHIAKVFSKYFMSLGEEGRHRFEADFQRLGLTTIMGEINRPWGEHLIPIEKLYMECFTVLAESDGLPLPAKDAFGFFTRHGLSSYEPNGRKDDGDVTTPMYHVPFSIHRIAELEACVVDIRRRKRCEGAVLYLCDASGETIGLVKVKATDYVVRRRLRESLKHTLVRKLASGAVQGFPVHSGSKPAKSSEIGTLKLETILSKIRRSLPSKLANLTHVPSHKVDAPSWGRYALEFLEWWITTRVARKRSSGKDAEWERLGTVEDYDRAILEWNRRYGTLLTKFDDFCRKKNEGTPRTKEEDK